VRAALSARPPPQGLTLSVTGCPAIEVASTHSLLVDQMVLTPVVLAIIAVVLYLTFRSLLGVALALTTVAVSIAWTAGIFSLLGRPVDIVASIIPTTLLVYGVVDPIFVLTRYLSKTERYSNREEAIVQTLSEMLLPCFLTSLTTALGFAAFITATMPTVRHLGIVVSIGVLFSFVTTVTVLPLLLAVVSPPRRVLSSLGFQRKVDAILVRGWAGLRDHRAASIAVAVALVALGANVARQIPIDDAYVDTAPNGPERKAARLAERELSGVVRYVAYFEGEPGSMKRPDVLRAIAAVDDRAEHDPLVNSSVSLADLLSEANQAFNGGDPAEYRLPTSPSLIAQYLTLIDPDDRSDFVNDDYSQSHVRVLAIDKGGLEGKRLREVLQDAVDRQHFEQYGVHVTLTGNGVVTYRELERITAEILWGFVVAFLIVVAFELVFFRSIRIALISVIPNLIPLGACFLAMRWAHVGFRLDTSLVLCVSIGGLFNTTIHLVERMRLELRQGTRDPDDVVLRSLRAVGPASFYTALTLATGFSALLLSSFPGLRALGAFAMVTMIVAFFSDAILTTTLMRTFYGWTKWTAVQRQPEVLANVVLENRTVPPT
jgi:predicted RND superfamily exporter protein